MQEDVDKLKKRLDYDPYTDTSLIPTAKAKMTEEEEKAYDEKVKAAMAKLAEDKFSNLIFVRQEYSLRDGRSVGLNPEVYYLYISAPDAFVSEMEKFFAEKFPNIKRATADDESKFIKLLNEEKEKANEGFGSIFGN